MAAEKYESLEGIYVQEEDNKNKTKSMVDINNDYVGWVKISDTRVNYPVVQTEDNDFYLSRNFYKEEDFAGAIFMDFRNSNKGLDKNIILYGHNMKDGSMFGSLKKYLDQDFYQKHKLITFDFLNTTYEWEIFSVYPSVHTDWMKTTFNDHQEFEAYLEKVISKSKVSTQTEVTEEDHILTLSTCTRDDQERFIIHAKLKNVRRDSVNENE